MNHQQFGEVPEDYDPKAATVKMDAKAIPDLTKLLCDIYELIDYVEKPMMQKLRIANKSEFEAKAYRKFQEQLPIKIVNLMCEDNRYEHLDKLLDMFEMLENVKDGNVDINDAFSIFSENLNAKFVYPKFGGKTQFEKQMAKDKINKK